MIILPIETEGHEQDALVIVLDADGFARMKEADPAEVVLRQWQEACQPNCVALL
jgi:hypothetical protein